jgi:hypothetical protein
MKMQPSLEPQVKEELNKLLLARIIFSFKDTQWISNLVHVRNKNGYIILCIDFINLNKSYEKYNYPIPPMEHILQCVSISEMLSLLDGFLDYNQVLVSHDDQLNMAFRTKWETYAYRKIPFELINVGETFQRAMDIDFRGLIGDFIVVYLNDVIVFSKDRKYHINHLRWIFNKSIFAVDEGRLGIYCIKRRHDNFS